MEWKDRVKKIRDKKERFRDKIDDRDKKETPKDLEKTKEYKNFQDAWEKLEDKKEEYKKKFSKKVKDYFKFMHDQLKEMYKDVGSPHELEDREKENFYKQVRKEWKKKKAKEDKPLNESMLGKFELTDHFINRMFERKVSPKKVKQVLDQGRQIKVLGPNYVIVKGTVMIPVNTQTKKMYTVVRNDKYLNWNDEDFIRAQIARARSRRTASSGKVTYNNIKSMDSLDEFLEYLGGEIPKEDPNEE